MLTDKVREWEGGQVSESQGGSLASYRLGSPWANTVTKPDLQTPLEERNEAHRGVKDWSPFTLG